MTYSFELFDLGLHRRAYWSAEDRERAGLFSEITHTDAVSRQFAYRANRREISESVVQIDIS